MKTKVFFLFLMGFAHLASAQQSTLGEGDSYAWAGNLGWIQLTPERPNALDGVRVGDYFLSGYGWSDSTGWINFGDGTPANSIRYANTTGADFGVNHDGAGNLSGLAWSVNLGWINFGWASANDSNRPRFDLYDGNFAGYAWSASAGWITLATGLLKTDIIAVTDDDSDGISDPWEFELAGGTGLLTADGDYDDDGISDVGEYGADTNPLNPDNFLEVIEFIPGDTSSELTWRSRPTRHYRVNLCNDLVGWEDSALDLIFPDAAETTTRTVPHTNEPRWFFQIQPVRPLSGN